MSQINSLERHGENQRIVLLFIYRAPKKNHGAMVQLNSRVIDTFKKYGIQRFEVFQLGSTEDMMDFVNISKTVQPTKTTRYGWRYNPTETESIWRRWEQR